MSKSYQRDLRGRAKSRRIEAINGLLVFNFLDNEFCIDLESLYEIRNVDEVKIDINSSKEAIILLDEHEYKVIQLNKLLGYPELNASTNNRIIFIDIFDKKIAFIVEMINELLTTEFLFLGDSLSMEFSPTKKYLKGAIKFQGRNIFIPDFEKICKDLNQLAIISGMSIRTNKTKDNYEYNRYKGQ